MRKTGLRLWLTAVVVAGTICVLWAIWGTRIQRAALRPAHSPPSQAKGERPTVTVFVPAPFTEHSLEVKLGRVSFRIPEADLVSVGASDSDGASLGLTFRDLRVIVRVPVRHKDRMHLCRMRAKHLPPELAADEVALRAAAYAVSQDDLAPYLPDGTSQSLRALLQVKTWICTGFVGDIEVVRSDNVKGLLLVAKARRPSVSFEYYSTDELTVGSVWFGTDSDEFIRAMAVIRAIVTSLKLQEHGSSEADDPARLVAKACAALDERRGGRNGEASSAPSAAVTSRPVSTPVPGN